MAASPAQPLLSTTDPRERYVRFQRLTDQGFVEFSFGIGTPDLMADLILPLDAYRLFCSANKVRYLTREQEDEQDFERSKWRYGAPGVTE